MNETVAVLGTFQTEFKTHHPEHTFAEQAQIAAVGALKDAGMTPGDIDAIVFSLAPTHFMGVADADRRLATADFRRRYVWEGVMVGAGQFLDQRQHRGGPVDDQAFGARGGRCGQREHEDC